jgi:hypothetical protein
MDRIRFPNSQIHARVSKGGLFAAIAAPGIQGCNRQIAERLAIAPEPVRDEKYKAIRKPRAHRT